MRKVAIVAVALLAVLLIEANGASSSLGRRVLRFGTMAAVVGPYVGPDHPIREVPGGGLPWQIDEAHGVLRAGGRLRIEVEGLVLLADDPVPADLQGTNPVPFFRGLVSCETIDAEGDAVTTNVSTDPFPATASGDAEILDTVSLPSPCFAPVVFVTSPTGQWFSVTGN
jgi:hypothetical protein